MHRANTDHQNDCRPLVAFNSQHRGQYSTFQHQRQQQENTKRKPTFLQVDKDNSAQDETIEMSSPPIFSKLSSIALSITSSKQAKGRAILLLVAFLYGTLNVTLRAVYASEGAPTASVLSLVRQCLSVLTFIPIIVSVNRNNAPEKVIDEEENLGIVSSTSSVEEDESNERPMWLAAAELAFWNCGAQVRHRSPSTYLIYVAQHLTTLQHFSWIDYNQLLILNRVSSMQGYWSALLQEHPSSHKQVS